MNALQVETDAQNTHMLLGGLLLTVQDAVTFEDNESAAVDHTPHHGAGLGNTEANVLSSGKHNFVLISFHSRFNKIVNIYIKFFNLWVP